jgi:CheY-like chemotaxis protein
VYGALTLERLEATRWSAEFYLGPFGSVKVIRQLKPKLVILDINMPGLSGTGIADLIRKTSDLTDLRVMFHSSMDQKELEALARAHGADLALSKSTGLSDFLRGVDRLMQLPPTRHR